MKNFSQESKLFEKSTIWIKSDKNQKENALFNENPTVKKIENLDDLKNKLSGKSTLFIAFNTNPKLETKILTLDYGTNKIDISNKGIFKKLILEHRFKDSPAKIISYTFNNPNLSIKAKNKLIIDLLTNQNIEENQLLEVIYFPEVLSDINIRKIETYLSIKYGISLDKEKDYISFKTDTIWNANRNKGFSKRVTGITDTYTIDFRQLKSGNSEKDGIYVAFDTLKIKKEILHNHSNYLLWGDNDKATLFKSNSTESELETFERSWKLQYSKFDYQLDSLFYTFSINKKELKIESSEKSNKKLWLVFSETEEGLINIHQAKLIPLKKEDSTFVTFKNIYLSKENYFSIVKLPEIFIQYEVVKNCDINEYVYNFTLNGGVSAYSIEILDSQKRLIEKKSLDDTKFSKTFNRSGNFYIVVSDKIGNSSIQEIIIEEIPNTEILLPTEILLSENGNQNITPVIIKDAKSDYKFEWIFNNEVISNQKDITVEQTGDYIFKVTNKDCSKQYTVKVIDKNTSSANSEIVLKPNPIKAGEKFSLVFTYPKSQNIEIIIHDNSGKIVFQKQFKEIIHYEFTHSFPVSGVYLISVLNQEKKQVFKLIVL
ncbi:T9SS type A sorting domain-containing protein [Flavobacterium profundi]|uniref:T9SS type A sorting domain-containing protein n=1 Tax=Flavobacterium profundi TaxID=1774945 RepID=UPI0015E7EC25|nr:T9SS type A sorting domain-containing protein [Flavobacterium profundi]